MPDPFMVVATQNPIEHEGTFPLPEAQLDRFLLHLRLDLPGAEAERAILDLVEAEAVAPRIQAGTMIRAADLAQARAEVARIAGRRSRPRPDVGGPGENGCHGTR